MGFVTSIFPRRMVQAAGSAVNAPALLRSIGLDPKGSLDVDQMVSDEAYYDLLERIAAEIPRAHELPLRVAKLMRPNDYGALGLAWKSAPTIRQSLERVERFCRLWTDNLTYEIRHDEGGVLFLLHRTGDRRLGMRLSNEATVASATSLIRQTSSPRFRPREVFLRHREPESTSVHERYFGCPVYFSSDMDGLSISNEALGRPNHLADDGVHRFLVSHLEERLESVATETTVEALVQREVSQSLSEGVPQKSSIARRLGMSERTLHRRLAERGLSFRSVVETTRARLAESLLRESKYSVAEVAFLTGFSEQSAFHRAFKRWSGQTPTSFRTRA